MCDCLYNYFQVLFFFVFFLKKFKLWIITEKYWYVSVDTISSIKEALLQILFRLHPGRDYRYDYECKSRPRTSSVQAMAANCIDNFGFFVGILSRKLLVSSNVSCILLLQKCITSELVINEHCSVWLITYFEYLNY